jgi:hypothetical protein
VVRRVVADVAAAFEHRCRVALPCGAKVAVEDRSGGEKQIICSGRDVTPLAERVLFFQGAPSKVTLRVATPATLVALLAEALYGDAEALAYIDPQLADSAVARPS